MNPMLHISLICGAVLFISIGVAALFMLGIAIGEDQCGRCASRRKRITQHRKDFERADQDSDEQALTTRATGPRAVWEIEMLQAQAQAEQGAESVGTGRPLHVLPPDALADLRRKLSASSCSPTTLGFDRPTRHRA